MSGQRVLVAVREVAVNNILEGLTQMTEGELLKEVLDSLDSLAFTAHMNDIISHDEKCDICQLVQVARTSLHPDRPYPHRNGERTPPKIEGSYWVRRVEEGKDGLFWVIDVWRSPTSGVLGCKKYSEVFLANIVSSPDDYGDELYWYGPIPEPEMEQ